MQYFPFLSVCYAKFVDRKPPQDVAIYEVTDFDAGGAKAKTFRICDLDERL
jgi:hypothetical protein